MATEKKEYQVSGKNNNAKFTLKIHRGEGMLLLGMNWKDNKKPPDDFVGFSIEYKAPGSDKFYSVPNRLSFPDKDGKVSKKSVPSYLAPFQKFRWVHFPYNADKGGDFIYKVRPVFMDSNDELSYGEEQEATIELMRETHKKKLNVAFTRGFVSSQAFVEYYGGSSAIPTLLPPDSKQGLTFKPTHKNARNALEWMGFEARKVILELLDKAIEDKTAQVMVIAYDLNEPEIVSRLEKLKKRLRIIIDDSPDHAEAGSAENQAQKILEKSADSVKRHHMSQLQHNKVIVIDGKLKAVVCGSTNFSWRGLYVQANNAVVVYGAKALKPFAEAFENYWQFDSVKDFGKTTSALWNDLNLTDIDARVSFSPHSSNNVLLDVIATDLDKTKSSLFYSLAFLYQTSGAIRDSITELTKNDELFIYGISDKKVGGIQLQKPSGNVVPVYASELSKNLPEPFKSEPSGGKGTRMHHKFVVIDFDKPTARVYLGSYNFSPTADNKNGENLLLIQDRKIAVAYMIEALRLFDHYHFRVSQKEAQQGKKKLGLLKPPRKAKEVPWWLEYYEDKRKKRDRELFS